MDYRLFCRWVDFDPMVRGGGGLRSTPPLKRMRTEIVGRTAEMEAISFRAKVSTDELRRSLDLSLFAGLLQWAKLCSRLSTPALEALGSPCFHVIETEHNLF